MDPGLQGRKGLLFPDQPGADPQVLGGDGEDQDPDGGQNPNRHEGRHEAKRFPPSGFPGGFESPDPVALYFLDNPTPFMGFLLGSISGKGLD
jgi:hypothetical protein